MPPIDFAFVANLHDSDSSVVKVVLSVVGAGGRQQWQATDEPLHRVTTSHDRVHGFATVNGTAVQLFLINKYNRSMPVAVQLPHPEIGRGAGTGGHAASVEVGAPARTANSGFHLNMLDSMVDTADHWGALVISTNVSCSGSTCTLLLPPFSFSRAWATAGEAVV
jgi:hypothetical protein